MIPKSNEVRFEVTTKCNYRCLICPREKLTRKLETMTLDTFKFLLDKITGETDQYNICTFSGFGESLLDPTLNSKVEYARRKGFRVLMLTNASMLTMERFKIFDELGVSSIRVSFYGNSEEVYNRIHNISQEELFEKIKKCLTDMCRIKKNTKILLTYNVEKSVNEGDTASWIQYWQDKADLLEVWRPHNWVDGREYRKVQKDKMKTCGRPWKTPLQVQVDGTVNMCCFDFDGKLTLGDLKKQPLSEIFASEMYKKIVKHNTSGDFTSSGLICENCSQRNIRKDDVMIYSSKFDIGERVKQVSTTYQDVVHE